MALQDLDDKARLRNVKVLDYLAEFNQTWKWIPPAEQAAIVAEINHRLDTLLAPPNPRWGSIMNTSIEGGEANPHTGVKGDWSGTVFHAIYVPCGFKRHISGMFYGNVLNKCLIGRK